MVNKYRTFLLVAFILFSAFAVSAQDALTNESVIALVKGGLSGPVVIAKIKAGVPHFDTSAAALVKLNEAGVPESVIIAMIDRQGRDDAAERKAVKKDDEELSTIPEQGNIKELVTLKNFHIMTDHMKARDRIIKVLTGAGFKFVDTPEQTAAVGFIVWWKEREDYVPNSLYTNRVGNMLVTRVTGDSELGRLRHIFSTQKEKFYVFTTDPAQAAAQELLKAMRNAGLKK